MKHPFLPLFLFLILFSSMTFAQIGQDVKIYATYEDFQNGKGRELGKFKDFSYSAAGFTLKTVKKGKKISEKLGKDWGFSLDSMVFRIKKGYPYAIVFISPYMVYCENGGLILNGMVETTHTMEGTPSFVSRTLDSKIIPIPALGGVKKMFEDVPEVQEFLTCIKWLNQYDRKRIVECWKEHIPAE